MSSSIKTRIAIKFPGQNDLSLGAAGLTPGLYIVGSSLNETFLGSAGNDTIFGGGGADFLHGLDGDDYLSQLNGGGTLYGGSGNDNLSALGGYLSGESGNDYLAVYNGYASLVGGSGDDTLDGDDYFGAYLFGGEGNDTYVIRENIVNFDNDDPGTDVIIADQDFTYSATDFSIEPLLGIENLILRGDYIGGTGNQANNYITGNRLNNSLVGLTGNDTLDGGSGSDTLIGGDGDDYLLDNEGGDVLLGDNGNDTLLGETNLDSLIGGDGNDTYIVSDQVRFVFTAGAGIYTYRDNGIDTILVHGDAYSYSLQFTQVENLVLQGDIIGGEGNSANNSITGNNLGNLLHGLDGADRLSGQNGDDVLYGENGNDFLLGDTGDDFLSGGEGLDDLRGGDGNDIAAGNGGSDSLDGGNGNDILYGDEISTDQFAASGGDDYIYGYYGADTVYGGGGRDTVSGGRNDLVFVNGQPAYDATHVQGDLVFGGAGDDTVRNDNIGFASAGADTLVGGVGNDLILLQQGYFGQQVVSFAYSVVNGTIEGKDTILGVQGDTVDSRTFFDGSYAGPQYNLPDLISLRDLLTDLGYGQNDAIARNAAWSIQSTGEESGGLRFFELMVDTDVGSATNWVAIARVGVTALAGVLDSGTLGADNIIV